MDQSNITVKDLEKRINQELEGFKEGISGDVGLAWRDP